MSEVHYLDTSTCIYALKGTHPTIGRELARRSPRDIRVPSIVQGELLYGAEKSEQRTKVLETLARFLDAFEIVPFCTRSAPHYARVRADLERRGTPIGPNDLIIAATVLANNGVLVTHNVKEFGRVKGLRIADWTS